MDKLQLKGILIWSLCVLFSLYTFFLRTVIGTYQFPIMQDLQLTSFQFSWLSTTIFLLIYGIMQIPVSLIVDNIGLKKSLTIGALACAFSCMGFAFSHTYYMAMLYRMVMGFGVSFAFIGLLISIRDWMPSRYNAIFIGISQFIVTLGPILATGPLNALSEATGLGWKSTFLYLGGMGTLFSGIIFLFVESHQKKSGQYIILHKPEKISKSLIPMCSKIQPWYIALLSASLYFAVAYLSENEGCSFLLLKGLSLTSASYMITTAWIGFAIACPLLGFFSDIFKRRKIIMSLCSLLGLAALAMILYNSNRHYLQWAFFALGVSAAGQNIGFATIGEHFKKEFISIGFALNNTIITLISIINAPLMGFLLDYKKQESVISLSAYHTVFSVLLITAATAIIISLFFVKETYCKSAVDFTYLRPKSKKRPYFSLQNLIRHSKKISSLKPNFGGHLYKKETL